MITTYTNIYFAFNILMKKYLDGKNYLDGKKYLDEKNILSNKIIV